MGKGPGFPRPSIERVANNRKMGDVMIPCLTRLVHHPGDAVAPNIATTTTTTTTMATRRRPHLCVAATSMELQFLIGSREFGNQVLRDEGTIIQVYLLIATTSSQARGA